MILQILFFVLTNAQQTEAPSCDPFTTKCPDVDCDLPQVSGQVLINSPNATSYQYVDKPINFTISFTTQTNER